MRPKQNFSLHLLYLEEEGWVRSKKYHQHRIEERRDGAMNHQILGNNLLPSWGAWEILTQPRCLMAGSTSMTRIIYHHCHDDNGAAKLFLHKKYWGSGVAWPVSKPEPNRRSLEEAKTVRCPATAVKTERSGDDLHRGVGQNPFCSANLVQNYRKREAAAIMSKGFYTKR